MSDISKIFEKIAHESVADMVVEEIENMIINGVLSDGDRLPSERELSELMKVSRPKIREALKKLVGAGLLEVRHGDGTFVAQLTGDAMTPALIHLYGRHGLAFFDYLEYRREQEGFAARCAAERATPPDCEAIKAYLETLIAAYEDNDMDRSLKADIAFHMAIVKASHNVMLIHMMRSIYDLTEQKIFFSRHHLREIDGSSKALLNQHKAIAHAILAGDPDKAEAAARAHMDYVEEKFRWQNAFERRKSVARKRQHQSSLS
ncbi:MAG: FadR/GntR family transcriptional regulator [Pseudomonadota bacterium]